MSRARMWLSRCGGTENEDGGPHQGFSRELLSSKGKEDGHIISLNPAGCQSRVPTAITTLRGNSYAPAIKHSEVSLPALHQIQARPPA